MNGDSFAFGIGISTHFEAQIDKSYQPLFIVKYVQGIPNMNLL